MTSRSKVYFAATGALAGLFYLPVPVVAAPQTAAPTASSTVRTATPADNQSQNAPNQPGAGQSTVTNRANITANTANNNGANTKANTANASNNANANNTAGRRDHQHRHSVHNEMMVPLYGYVPYNGFYNEGFGYNNGWYDYSDIGPYIDNSNYGQSDESGFVSSNTNGEVAGTALPPPATSAPATQLSADAQGARATMIEEQARIMKEFEAKPEYQAALKDLKQATDNFNAAVANARSSLKQTPEYQKATAQQQQAEQKVEAEQTAHRVSPTTAETAPTAAAPNGAFSLEVTHAAEQKLNAKNQLNSLQKENINDNPQVKQARDKLDSAMAAFNAQKAKLTETVMADKGWQAAKQKYDAALKG